MVWAGTVTDEGVCAMSTASANGDHSAVRAAAAVAAGLGGLAVLRFVLPAATPRIRAGGKTGPGGVAVLEKIRIGGSDQWVLERSEDAGNPLVLFLHGGPGTSQLTSNRRDTRGLEKYFTVVNWDQRAAGKSYGAIHDPARMNISQFVADTRELTVYLLEKFHQDRLVLVGHSWGTVIGALAVSRYPELYSCYVGISQIGNMAEGEAASYRWTLDQARKHNKRRAVDALVAMGPPPYEGDWQKKTITQRSYLARFGGELHRSRLGASGRVVSGVLLSREYTLADRVNVFRGILGSMRLLWPELLQVDLFESVPEMKVPVFLMEGRHDHECPSEIAERYFSALRAPGKELIWFDRSAHLPNAEERDLFNKIMVEEILPIAGRRSIP
jgi:pimeloyl-ACP methyl ester carboxylesterase